VLAVDQFEELFTLCRDDGERREFVERLLTYEEPVVVALRGDFYGHCGEYPELAAALERSQALVGPMGEQELRRAIEYPAQRVGLHLEHRLIEAALHDVIGQPGALPLLSHALLETWKRRIGRTLTLGGYLEAGGVEGAVAKTAEEVYGGLAPEEQPLARSIFLRLTALGEGTEDTRRRVAVTELVLREGEEARVESVLDRLVEARLVMRDQGAAEVAHEALIRHWPTLRVWLDEDREGRRTHRRLTEAAQEWDALGREPSALYRGARFATAAEWADANPDELNEQERVFLEASRAAEQSELDQARRRNRRLRVLVGALALLLVGAAVAAVIAVRQTGQAREQERAAEEQTRLAQEQEQIALERERVAVSRALASQSLELLDRRPDQALLVGLESYRTDPTFEARSSLLAAIQRTRSMEAVISHQGSAIQSVAVSPDGRLIATGDRAGNVIVRDAATRLPVADPIRLDTGVGGVILLAIDPSSSSLAAVTSDGSVWVARTAGSEEPRRLDTFDQTPVIAFANLGRVLVATNGGAAASWDVTRGRELNRVGGRSAEFFAGIALSSNGEVLATHPLRSSGEPATFELADGATGRTIREIVADADRVSDNALVPIALSSDGKQLAFPDAGSTVTVVEIATGQERIVVADESADVSALALDADGGRIALGKEDGSVELYDTATGTPLAPRFPGHTARVSDLAFAADGSRLITVGADGLALLWSPEGEGSLERPLVSGGTEFYDLDVSPDGSLIGLADFSRGVQIVDLETGARLARPTLAATAGLTFHPDGRTLALAADCAVLIRSLSERRAVDELSEPGFCPTGVQYSPDGTLLAGWGGDDGVNGDVAVWDLRSLAVSSVPSPGGSSSLPWNARFSPDSNRLAVAYDDGSIGLFDVDDLDAPPRLLLGHEPPAYDLDFSPDGEALASVGADGAVRVWNLPDGTPRGEPVPVSSAFLGTVRFTSDGKTLLAVEENWVRILDHAELASLGEIALRSSQPLLGLLADGAAVVQSGPIVTRLDSLLWSDDLDLLGERVCDLVGRSLTAEEWEQFVPGLDYRETCPTASG
jgi:WD40 repeat protein